MSYQAPGYPWLKHDWCRIVEESYVDARRSQKSRQAPEHQPTTREVATSPTFIRDTRVELLVLATFYSFSILSSLAEHSVASIVAEAALCCTMPTDIRSFFGGGTAQSSLKKTPAKKEVCFIISHSLSYLNIHLQNLVKDL